MTHFYILHRNCNPTLRGSCGGSYWGGPVYGRGHEASGGVERSPHHSATGKGPGALAALDLVPTTFPQLQTRPRPPMLPVQSQASSRLPGKPPSLPVTQPRGRLSPLLLFIGHDQAGVQDVLFWLPRAVPGRETRGQSCPAPPSTHSGHSCSTRAHCLQPLPPFWYRKLSPSPRSCS